MKSLIILSIVTLLTTNVFAGGESLNQIDTFHLDSAFERIQSLSHVNGLSRVDIRANRSYLRKMLYRARFCSLSEECFIVFRGREVLRAYEALEDFYNEGWSIIEDLDNYANEL